MVVLPHPGGRRGHGIPLTEGLASFPPPRKDPGGWVGHLTTDRGLLGGCPAGTSSSWSGICPRIHEERCSGWVWKLPSAQVAEQGLPPNTVLFCWPGSRVS